jgi:septum formation protein
MKRQIILASQSPQRQNIFQTLGLPFEAVPADLDERAIIDPDLKLRARLVAEAKVKKVAQQFAQAIVLGADTYPVLADQALEKPADLAEARQMLTQLSGQEITEYSGFCYLDQQSGYFWSDTSVTTAVFRPLSPSEIDRYVEQNPVTTWSSAFSPAYDAGAALIQSVNGSLTSFTHGLPMEWVVECLAKSGVRI